MSPKVSTRSHPLRMSTRCRPVWKKVSTRCHCPRNVSIPCEEIIRYFKNWNKLSGKIINTYKHGKQILFVTSYRTFLIHTKVIFSSKYSRSKKVICNVPIQIPQRMSFDRRRKKKEKFLTGSIGSNVSSNVNSSYTFSRQKSRWNSCHVFYFFPTLELHLGWLF